MFGGHLHAPNDDHGIEGSAGHHIRAWVPGDAVDTRVVEAPLQLVELLKAGQTINNHLRGKKWLISAFATSALV